MIGGGLAEIFLGLSGNLGLSLAINGASFWILIEAKNGLFVGRAN